MDYTTMLRRLDKRWFGARACCPICGEANCTINHRRRDDRLFLRQVDHDRGVHLACWADAYCRNR